MRNETESKLRDIQDKLVDELADIADDVNDGPAAPGYPPAGKADTILSRIGHIEQIINPQEGSH